MWLRRRRLTPSGLTKRWQSSVAAQPADQSPTHIADAPKELCYFTEFAHSPVDLHFLLLTEAHRKHGVNLNVPPQLPPPGSPPEVPDVIFNEAQTERLRGLKLAYEPTYGPPPLATTGTRGLADIADISPTPSPTVTALSSESLSVTHHRKAIEVDKKFHCSLCGKPFRIELSAVHHVKEMHKGDPTAKALPGPGPGELEVVVAPVVVPLTTAAPLVAADDAKPVVLTDSQFKKLSCVTLPSEDEVDDLLRRIWDDIGRKRGGDKFTALSDAVVGIADDRKPFSELDLKPLVRATPENAAPGVKRTSKLSDNAQRTPTSLKELSARFPNPFGDSAESKLLQQMKDEPLNPFIPVTTKPPSPTAGNEGAGQPSLHRAATERPYQCHVCSKSFRLMDGLMDHLQTLHNIELSSDELRALLARRTTNNPFVAPKKEMSEGTTSAGSSDSEGSAEGIISTNDLAALPPAPVLEADVGVHIRAGSNVVLLGEVVDIQKGFVKSMSVTQFVIKTTEPSTRSDQNYVAEAAEEPNEEFVVVRVLGDSMKYIVDHIKVSQSIMVHGCLKMNRRLDDVSKRSHAYPFIQVLAPLGSIVVVE